MAHVGFSNGPLVVGVVENHKQVGFRHNRLFLCQRRKELLVLCSLLLLVSRVSALFDGDVHLGDFIWIEPDATTKHTFSICDCPAS
jgi:hypothetical protein